ncbi:hypothetical protein ABS765_09240 [Chryseobacterium sp. ST-37]|uniref:PEGA domain-containing protein n=2 Tax=Chryseobacterium terrae TaxID=3163299 RepID=A0ABW8Y4H6_9FLAO
MRNKTTIQLLILILTMISCNKIKIPVEPVKVDVSYDSETQKGNLIVDGKQTFKLPSDSMSITIKLTEGSHTFKLNKEKEFTEFVPKEGGILNLNNASFVTIIEPYVSQTIENSYGFDPNNDTRLNQHFLIIDSTVYYYKKDTLQNVSDLDIKNAIAFSKKLKGTSAMKYFEPKRFIAKEWNFGLNEDFPETITEETSSIAIPVKGTRYKRKVVELTLFKLYALMSPQYFVVRNLKDVMESKEDIKEDSKKSSRQMQFDK